MQILLRKHVQASPISHIFVHHPLGTVWQRVAASFQPTLVDDDLELEWSIGYPEIQLRNARSGSIGSIKLNKGPGGGTLIGFIPPQPPSLEETADVEDFIRSIILDHRGILADLFANRERSLDTLAMYLSDYNQKQLLKVRDWLSRVLELWGLGNEQKLPPIFRFIIDGTPAQLAVMLRQYLPVLSMLDGFAKATVRIQRPGSGEIRDLPADINPNQAIITIRKTRLEITAHTLPNQRTLLRVVVADGNECWRLWEAVRTEMEKLAWITFSAIPSKQPIENTNHSGYAKSGDAPVDSWTRVPDVGGNREILRYWHQGLTCAQIGKRVGLSEKTILNRVNKLRKQFGAEIVPYRKSHFSQ